jgi:hypothetical protein
MMLTPGYVMFAGPGQVSGQRGDSPLLDGPDRPIFFRIFSLHNIEIGALDNLRRVVGLQRGLVDAFEVRDVV